jgi:glutamine synthetase
MSTSTALLPDRSSRSRAEREEHDAMREIEIHDYARQLLEAHGAKAIAEAAQNAIELEAACRRRHETYARAAPELKLPVRARQRRACMRAPPSRIRPVRRRRRSWNVDQNPSLAGWQRTNGNTIFKAFPLDYRSEAMVPNCATAEDLLKAIKDDKVQMIDLRFSDLPGVWQHFSVPPSAVNIDALEEGIGFDGSSIRGFQEIQESDMLVVPDPTTAFVDPFTPATTLVLICNIRDPVTGQSYSRDPRFIAQKAETYLKGTGRADTSYFGPEAEFFVFNDVRYGQGINYAFHEIDSREGSWNTGKEEAPNLGHKPRPKEGYFPVPPTDSMQALRTEMVLTMESLGIQIEAHHHEVATGGQNEIDMRFTTLTRMADNLMIYKYVVKNTARQHDMTATFMPKPLFEDNASGMHVHQSLWKGETNLFYDKGDYAELSELGRYYIGGLLTHAWALCGLCAPTTNSYRRLVPGYEAPINLVYSQRNRSACCRIPMYSPNPRAKRVEFRSPDPSCNPYLAFAAMLMAGLDGIDKRIDPGSPIDKNLYDLPPAEAKEVKSTPGSLDQALDALERDHAFLLRGDVFTRDVIETWLDYKRKREVDAIRLRPHPHEFHLYYDI